MRQEVEYIPPETSPKLMPTPFLLSGRLILQLHPKHMWWNVLWLIGKENSRNPALSPSAKGGGKKLSVGAGCNGGNGCISQRLTDSCKSAKRASPFLGWLAHCCTSTSCLWMRKGGEMRASGGARAEKRLWLNVCFDTQSNRKMPDFITIPEDSVNQEG